jgi:hypothetical protein
MRQNLSRRDSRDAITPLVTNPTSSIGDTTLHENYAHPGRQQQQQQQQQPPLEAGAAIASTASSMWHSTWCVQPNACCGANYDAANAQNRHGEHVDTTNLKQTKHTKQTNPLFLPLQRGAGPMALMLWLDWVR